MDGVIYKPDTLQQLADCFQKMFPNWSERAPLDDQDVSEGADANPHGLSGERTDKDGASFFDESVLQGLEEMGGRDNPGFVRRIFDLYLEYAPRACAEISNAARVNDFETCGRAAHSLKSMSHNIGAVEVAASADAIERRARNDNRVANAEELDRVAKSLAASLEFIAALRQRVHEHETTAVRSDLRNHPVVRQQI